MQRFAHPAAQAAGHLHALLHGHVADRHKRHHIGRAQARVLAGVLVEVDVLGGGGNSLVSGFFHGIRRAHIGENGAVVIHIGVPVEHGYARHRGD